MPLILIGVNHRTTPLELREQLSVTDSQLTPAIAELAEVPGIDGVSMLSTCNRVEAVISASTEDVIEPVVDWLAGRAHAPRIALEAHLYVLRHADVIKHLFRVAAGLDSMIVGEPQIHGQVRKAFAASSEMRSLDPILQQLFEQTMRVAKRVRTETGIGEHAVSVPYAAVELAKKIFGDLSGLQVLLLGAGEIGELTAEHLAGLGTKQIFVANRSHERAIELASRFHGEAIHFDAIEPYLATCDIVIASTGAPHFVIDAAQVDRALASRKMRNLFLIDLAVPRNIDPAIAKLSGAYLYNIDDLQHVADSNRDLRLQKAQQAEEIISREVENFRKRMATQEAVPTILELQQRLEAIRAAELEKCLRRLGPITTEQREAVEMLTTQMINKILHYPILQLKESLQESVDEPHERESLKRTIRKLFGLGTR
ncbi:MAG TPA: glutamyl-tRNA reductase [Thermoanaerobaculia bacterium]|nr:glutamyl-tRNA reductase [Thermoanaerobaculia bacterium]